MIGTWVREVKLKTKAKMNVEKGPCFCASLLPLVGQPMMPHAVVCR